MTRTTDPMEQLIERALVDAGIRYETNAAHHLDFDLPDHGIAIEVKQFHSDRIAEQMSRADNVIAAQGERAVRFLAAALRALAEREALPESPAADTLPG